MKYFYQLPRVFRFIFNYFDLILGQIWAKLWAQEAKNQPKITLQNLWFFPPVFGTLLIDIFDKKKKRKNDFFKYFSMIFATYFSLLWICAHMCPSESLRGQNIYRTRAIISHSWFEAALIYKPRILSFKKVYRNIGRSAA